MRATCPAHLILLELVVLIKFSEYNMELLIMQFLQPHVTSSLLGPNFLLRILFSNTLNARDQLSDPYKTTGKITLLYVF
jgi:hypothetical protein